MTMEMSMALAIADCYAPDVDVDDIDAADTRELKLILMIK